MDECKEGCEAQQKTWFPHNVDICETVEFCLKKCTFSFVVGSLEKNNNLRIRLINTLY